ncbi:MAG: hypothetical protein KGQ41_03245 [Alphaproteobacteria bacterium]|nr:hypothetical protein [Alphaproteobacteria bacterium]
MRTLLVLAFSLLFSGAALAAPAIDKAGADALKPRLEQGLDVLAANFKAKGLLLERTGPLTVEPAGTYYAVTTPSLALIMPGNIKRTIGMVAVNAVPTANPDVLKVAMALPTPIIDTDGMGKAVGKTTIGSQTMNGLWNVPAMMFTQLTANYGNVQTVGDGFKTTLPQLAVKMLLSDNGKGLYSGPSEAVATNITHETTAKKYTISQLALKTVIEDLDIKAAQTPAKKASSASLQDTLTDMFTRFANGNQTSFSASGISIAQLDGSGQPQTTTIKNITFNGNIGDARTSLPKMEWSGTASGFATTDASFANFMPTTISVNGATSGVPLAELLAAKTQAEQAAIMAKSGGLFKLNNFSIDAPAYGLTSIGSVKSGAEGQNASLKLVVRGLPDLLAWLGTLSSGPDAKNLPPFLPALTGILAMVQMTGKPATDIQGRPTLNYDVQMAGGKLTLNGADMTAVLGGLPQGKGATPQAAPR